MRVFVLFFCLLSIIEPTYGQSDCYENISKFNKRKLYAYWDSLLNVKPSQVIDEAGAYYESGERLKDRAICSDAAFYLGMGNHHISYDNFSNHIFWFKMAAGDKVGTAANSDNQKKAALNLFSTYFQNNQLDSALFWGTKLQKAYESIKDSNKLTFIYNYKSLAFQALGNEDSCSFYKGLSNRMIKTTKKDAHTLSICAYNIVADTVSLMQKVTSIKNILKEYHNLEHDEYTQNPNNKDLQSIYLSLAKVYLQHEMYDSALHSLAHCDFSTFVIAKYASICYIEKGNSSQAEKIISQIDTTHFHEEHWTYYYELLYSFYSDESDTEKAIYYLEKLQEATENLAMSRIEENTKLAQRNYVLQQQNHQQALTEEQNKLRLKKLQLSIAVIGILLLLALLAAIYFYFRIRQQKMAAQISLFEQEKENIRLKSLIEGENEERSRISQELHDDISGNLSVAKMLAQRSKHSNPALAEDAHYNKMIALMDETYNSVRNIAHSLSTNIITELGLVKSLERYIKLVNAARTDIQFQFFASDVENLAYDNQKLLILYRCVQELIQNTLKHAEASQGKLVLRQNKEGFELELSDNGKGIRMQSQAGIGMGNIRDRIQSIGGTVVWENKDEGVSTTIILP